MQLGIRTVKRLADFSELTAFSKISNTAPTSFSSKTTLDCRQCPKEQQERHIFDSDKPSFAKFEKQGAQELDCDAFDCVKTL
jgi:hypothetical protein